MKSIKIISFGIAGILLLGGLNICSAPPASSAEAFLKQLSQEAKQKKTEKPFSEIIDLAEDAVNVMRKEYFRINEDYTDHLLGDKLKEVTNYLAQISRNNAEIYKTALTDLQSRHIELNRKKDEAAARATDAKAKKLDVEAQIAGVQARQQVLEKDRNNAQDKYDKAKKGVGGKEFLQGFLTGISLGIYKGDFGSAQREADKLKGRLEDLKREENGLKSNLDRLQKASDAYKREEKDYDGQIKEYSAKINLSKIKEQEYSDLALFFGNASAEFKYTAAGVNAVLDELSSVRGKYKDISPSIIAAQYNGQVIKTDENNLYFVFDNKASRIKNTQSFNAVFLNSALEKVMRVTPSTLDSLPKGEDIDSPALLRESGKDEVYFVARANDPASQKHWIINPDVFNKCGFDWGKIRVVPSLKFAKGVNIE